MSSGDIFCRTFDGDGRAPCGCQWVRNGYGDVLELCRWHRQSSRAVEASIARDGNLPQGWSVNDRKGR